MSPTAAQRALASVTGPVGLADTNSTLTFSPAPVCVVPYAAPAATMSAATWPCAPLSTVMLRKPGPAMSTLAMPSAVSRRLATSSAKARGLVPACLASCSATLVA